MSYALTIRPAAEADIREAALWYESQRIGLSEDFFDDLIATMTYLESAPLSFARVGARFRQVPMSRFPFLLIYEILNANEVVLLAVFHTSRDPELKP